MNAASRSAQYLQEAASISNSRARPRNTEISSLAWPEWDRHSARPHSRADSRVVGMTTAADDDAAVWIICPTAGLVYVEQEWVVLAALRTSGPLQVICGDDALAAGRCQLDLDLEGSYGVDVLEIEVALMGPFFDSVRVGLESPTCNRLTPERLKGLNFAPEERLDRIPVTTNCRSISLAFYIENGDASGGKDAHRMDAHQNHPSQA